MNIYPKRLIEVDLPIRRISEHARREKSIRHGHISTLHIWWARRPLAACRAVLCAALWPDPVDPLCPQAFRDAAAAAVNGFAKSVCESEAVLKILGDHAGSFLVLTRDRVDAANPAHWNTLRYLLLDFIAGFAAWEASTEPHFLETARKLTQAAHEALGGAPGTRPLVVDPFAGGGSIPLEALRVGADAFASDLNPVAVLLNKVVLEYIPKYGQRLADEVRKWGQWIKEEAEKELAEFYPKDPDGATPIAYLWARTITCEGPGCGAEVPLMRSLWLAKKANRSIALKMLIADGGQHGGKRIEFIIVERRGKEWVCIDAPEDLGSLTGTIVRDVEPDRGTVKRGSATCPVCGYTTPIVSVRQQLKTRQGGAVDARLFSVVTTRTGAQGRYYRLPVKHDLDAVRKAIVELESQEKAHKSNVSLAPNESTEQYHSFVNRGPIYGMLKWGDYFTPRQLLALTTLTRLVQKMDGEEEGGLAVAVKTCLGLAVDKQADSNSSLCSWRSTSQDIGHTFGRQALPMLWDFVEANILSGATRDWMNAVEGGLKALSSLDQGIIGGHVERASATDHPLPDDSAECFFTDPPYYYSMQYADLSDFFYVWLKRSLAGLYPNLLDLVVTEKEDEIIVQSPGHEFASEGKNNLFYESRMKVAMAEGRRVLNPSGVGAVVFANTMTRGWEAMLQALVESGWVITASWPIDTEMASRILAQNRSVLGSSIHLVCRPRENPDGSLRIDDVGNWRDVLRELPERIHEWLPRLADEGVVGADAIFACLGPALEIFSRHSRVEKASGEVVTLREYLEQVWAAVSKEALTLVFKDADTGAFEEDARLTAMWLWTLGANMAPEGAESAEEDSEDGADEEDGKSRKSLSGGYTLEYDAARKIAQGLGAHLEALTSLVEVKGDKATLLPVSARTRKLFGREEAGGSAPSGATAGRRRAGAKQLDLFVTLEQLEMEEEREASSVADKAPPPGATVLDRVHQAMILFGAGRSEAMKRFLVDDGTGNDPRFWSLAQAFSALYPSSSEEKRWVDGVLARKKGLGF
ncbi:MAG: DUF1156 domain-containing protein [Candidatus Hydrogenedentes bacterium]|nr:DUF1156 domain-containing protein [Candidatus Hydrogenedentota bacterium]